MRAAFLKQTLAVAALAAVPLAHGAELTGAGSTFAAPIYAKWAEAYHKATGNRINYQGIGSSGGIRQIKAKTVDFGGSDAPLRPEELQREGLVQFPTVVGGVVPVVNVRGIKPGQLRLTGRLLGDIYLGRIARWNDKAIADLNPGVPLPEQDIAVVRRADGSGTTFIFTNYLSKVNPEWKQKVGEGQAVQWPVGLGGKGNDGVAAFVQRLSGSIGYVEYAYAKQNRLAYTQLENSAGAFVRPGDAAFKAAAANAEWSKAAFYEILTNEPGKESWPITGATFVLLHKTSDKPQQTAEVLKFFDWAFEHGDRLASDLDYVPMPDSVVKLIRTSWASGIKDRSGKSLRAAEQ
jgi:phosphate transport system substrate-binding protein